MSSPKTSSFRCLYQRRKQERINFHIHFGKLTPSPRHAMPPMKEKAKAIEDVVRQSAKLSRAPSSRKQENKCRNMPLF